MKKRRFTVISLLLCVSMMIMGVSACSSKDSDSINTESNNDTTQEEVGEEPSKIAYLAPGLDLPFWRYLANGIENKVIDLGMNATVQVYDSNNSSETQLQNAQDAIINGVDIIIISPTDSSSCPAVLNAAEEAGVPVIIADIGTDEGKYDAFVITPNEAGAKELGEYTANYMKDKNLLDKKAAQITVSLARNNGKARFNGFNAALDETGIELADYRQLEDYTRAEAEAFAQDLMTTYSDLGIIFCHTDEPTLGVVQAVKNAGMEDDIIVVGFDATTETIEAIADGSILAAAVQQPALMGAYAVEAAVQLLNGETPEAEIDVPTLLVTQDNVIDADIQKKLNADVFPDSKKQ